MDKSLNFNPGYYKVTKLLEPNVLEVEELDFLNQNMWFVKLKGIRDNTPQKELKKWLRKGSIVRVIPYKQNAEAQITSDVWLGNTHINQQFPNYKRDNFIQVFEEWDKNRKANIYLSRETAGELIEAFYMAESLLSSNLKSSFKSWLESCFPQKRTGDVRPLIEESINKRETARKKLYKDFYNWKEKQI